MTRAGGLPKTLFSNKMFPYISTINFFGNFLIYLQL